MIPKTKGMETNIKLPFSFIFFSLVSLVISQILLVIDYETVSNGVFRIPGIWSAAHLFVLGWAVMVAMGAMYQLVPVAFLTPIWSEKLGFVQFVVTAGGILSFALALYYTPHHALIPGLITLLGILMFIFQMGMTLKKQAQPNLLTLFVGTALVCLLLTILLGILMVLMMKVGSGGFEYVSFLKSHILLGIAGWFSLLIFGFSYKMVPMFSLSHGYPMGLAKFIYIIYVAGLLVTVAGFIFTNRIILQVGFFLLFLGFFLFVRHMLIILKKRVKKKLDRPFQFALLAIGFGLILHFLALVFSFFQSFEKFAGPLVFMYLLTWIGFSILGYLYKIVPFLWWTYKYSEAIGKDKVPTLKDMINQRLAVPLFLLFLVGTFIVILGFGFHHAILYLSGQILIGIAVIIYSVTLISVITK
jgi:hypothetical protein